MKRVGIGLAVLMMLMMFSGCAMMDNTPAMTVPLVAHRGASFEKPENTTSAIVRAWEVGSPAAECDVYLTADNQIMLMHDKTTKRTTGVEYVMADTSSEMLCTLDAGVWKGAEFAGEPVPFLADVLETIPEGRVLFIEVKCGEEVLPYLKTVLEDYGKYDRIAIIAFNFDVIVGAKAMLPDVPAYWLTQTKQDKETKQWPEYDMALIEKVKTDGLDGLDVRYNGLTKEFVDAVHEAGLELFIWTVDDIDMAKAMLDMGVDGITTNKPVELNDALM